jgi:hypothetical protein
MAAEILDLNEAIWNASCRFYRGKGTCDSGCWNEPVCQTNEPITPWPDVISMWGAMAHESPLEEYDDDAGDRACCLAGPPVPQVSLDEVAPLLGLQKGPDCEVAQ